MNHAVACQGIQVILRHWRARQLRVTLLIALLALLIGDEEVVIALLALFILLLLLLAVGKHRLHALQLHRVHAHPLQLYLQRFNGQLQASPDRIDATWRVRSRSSSWLPYHAGFLYADFEMH